MSLPGKSLFLQRKHWSKKAGAGKTLKGREFLRQNDDDDDDVGVGEGGAAPLITMDMVALLMTCGLFLL